MELEHPPPRFWAWQGDVYSLFESEFRSRFNLHIRIARSATHLRLIALSNCQGMFVAPRTKTPVSSWPTPFI